MNSPENWIFEIVIGLIILAIAAIGVSLRKHIKKYIVDWKENLQLRKKELKIKYTVATRGIDNQHAPTRTKTLSLKDIIEAISSETIQKRTNS